VHGPRRRRLEPISSRRETWGPTTTRTCRRKRMPWGEHHEWYFVPPAITVRTSSGNALAELGPRDTLREASGVAAAPSSTNRTGHRERGKVPRKIQRGGGNRIQHAPVGQTRQRAGQRRPQASRAPRSIGKQPALSTTMAHRPHLAALSRRRHRHTSRCSRAPFALSDQGRTVSTIEAG